MNERERLIELVEVGNKLAVKKSLEQTVAFLREHHHYSSATDNTVSIVEEIADYLLANGVVVPPVKVGDTVYTNVSWTGWHLKEEDKPYKAKVIFIGINGEENFMNVLYEKNNDRSLAFTFDEIGDRLFLTREEAEEALLKEREESAKG